MNLENEYGIKVFARTAKGIEITPEGKDFIYYARNIITSINSMEKQFSSNTLQKKFVLSVASQQLDFLYDLLLCLYDQNKEKSIHFNIVEANRSHVVQSVLSGDVNIGIIVRSSADSKAFTWRLAAKNLEATIIDNSGVYVSMGPKSPYYNNEKISFAELEGQLHAVLDMEDEAIQDLYMNQIDNHINLQRVLFFNTINACKKFLLYTDAHLYTPKWVLNFFRGTEIHSLPISTTGNETIPTNELVWLKRKNETLNDIERQLIDSINNLFNNQGFD
jgi:DNA-binding transcriptional LysR family regulator